MRKLMLVGFLCMLACKDGSCTIEPINPTSRCGEACRPYRMAKQTSNGCGGQECVCSDVLIDAGK